MTEITCKACRSAPVAAESLCLVCLKDKLAADRDRRHRQERHQRRERHRDERGRPGAGWDRALLQRVVKP